MRIGADNQVNDLKILIGEDDESSLSFLLAALKTYCSEILSVGTGLEAVEACRNHPAAE
jgi:CheY-like chemotaxis protein